MLQINDTLLESYFHLIDEQRHAVNLVPKSCKIDLIRDANLLSEALAARGSIHFF